ncbi:MAG: hypothetical protein CMH55_07010, partial [Myxococcales bacterium]|nr:hypothetical protein [Myxococcales bacterium]
MAEKIWIIDPDDRSGSALEALLTEVSLEASHRSELTGPAPDLLVLAGSFDDDTLAAKIQQLRGLALGDVAAVVILGGSGDAGHALALGADLFIAAPTNLERFLQAIEPFVHIPIPVDAAERRVFESRATTPDATEAERQDEGEASPETPAAPEPHTLDQADDPPQQSREVSVDPTQSIAPPPIGDEGDLSSGMLQLIAETHDPHAVDVESPPSEPEIEAGPEPAPEPELVPEPEPELVPEPELELVPEPEPELVPEPEPELVPEPEPEL